MQTLEVISVNIWDILISLLNLLLIFLIFKKFLFKPVLKVLDKRKNAIDNQYKAAEQATADAEETKALYDNQLAGINEQADEILKSAAANADRRSTKIVDEAKEKADDLIRRAHNEIELEKKKAEGDIRTEIAEVSTILTEKMLEREINDEDHRRFIDTFIQGIGEDDGSDK